MGCRPQGRLGSRRLGLSDGTLALLPPHLDFVEPAKVCAKRHKEQAYSSTAIPAGRLCQKSEFSRLTADAGWQVRTGRLVGRPVGVVSRYRCPDRLRHRLGPGVPGYCPIIPSRGTQILLGSIGRAVGIPPIVTSTFSVITRKVPSASTVWQLQQLPS